MNDNSAESKKPKINRRDQVFRYLKYLLKNEIVCLFVFAGLRLNNTWASGTVKTLSTTRKPPFLTKFGLRLQVQALGGQPIEYKDEAK